MPAMRPAGPRFRASSRVWRALRAPPGPDEAHDAPAQQPHKRHQEHVAVAIETPNEYHLGRVGRVIPARVLLADDEASQLTFLLTAHGGHVAAKSRDVVR